MKNKHKQNRICVSLLAIFTTITLASTAQGIIFVHNLDSALALAKAANKPVFIDFYTSWCSPCKMMSNNVFPQEKVGNYFNSRFINCKIQCDDNGPGVEAGKKYQVYAYPTLMFLNPKGELIHSMAGGILADELIDLGNIAMNPEKNLLSYLSQWNNGRRDSGFVNMYFARLKSAYRSELARKQFEAYFNNLPQKEKTSRPVFNLIELLGYMPSTSMFSFLEDNQAQFKNNVGHDLVDRYLARAYRSWLTSMIHARGEAARKAYTEAKEAFRKKNYASFDEINMYLSVHETFDTVGRADIKEYQRRGTLFLAKYGETNDSYTIGLAGLLGNCTGKENEGEAGIKWMEDLLARKRDPQYLPTYFYVLWRNHQYDKALVVGEEMKSNAIRNNQPTKEIDDQIAMVNGIKEKEKEKKQKGAAKS